MPRIKAKDFLPPRQDKNRKTKYRPEYDAIAYMYAKQGVSVVQLARELGATQQAINRWMHKHPSFYVAFNLGRKAKDDVVEGALLRVALGYEFTEKKYERNEQGKMVLKEKVIKHKAPNTSAAMHWLSNRQGEYWDSKQGKMVDSNIKIVVKPPNKEEKE